MIKCALPTNTIQIKHNKSRIPTGGRLTSRLFTRLGRVEFGATEDKSIQRQGRGFEPGITGLMHVKAWLKPNLHKIRKTVITLPGFGIIFAELAA